MLVLGAGALSFLSSLTPTYGGSSLAREGKSSFSVSLCHCGWRVALELVSLPLCSHTAEGRSCLAFQLVRHSLFHSIVGGAWRALR